MNFQLRTYPFDNLFKENKILKTSVLLITNTPCFLEILYGRKFSRFLIICYTIRYKHTHNTHAATNRFLKIPKKQTAHNGTYSMRSTASVT